MYLIIIGVADKLYSGCYWWYERLWKASLTCKIASYLSVLSTEVSAFMITILTIDRIIAQHVPCDRFRFTGRSAMVVSGLTWLCGLSLAAVPLFTVFSHWHVYGHTSICIPTSDLAQISMTPETRCPGVHERGVGLQLYVSLYMCCTYHM